LSRTVDPLARYDDFLAGGPFAIDKKEPRSMISAALLVKPMQRSREYVMARHFALETNGPEIARLINNFLGKNVPVKKKAEK
jgi:hypothetical protein